MFSPSPKNWHHTSEDVPILRTTPSDFSTCDCLVPLILTATWPIGGGVVVFFHCSLIVSQVCLDSSFTTLEGLSLNVTSPCGPVTLLLVYCTGYSLFVCKNVLFLFPPNSLTYSSSKVFASTPIRPIQLAKSGRVETTTPPPKGHVAVRMRITRQSHEEKPEEVVRKIA